MFRFEKTRSETILAWHSTQRDILINIPRKDAAHVGTPERAAA